MLKNSHNFNFCTNINCTLTNTNDKPIDKIIIKQEKWDNQCVLKIDKPDDIYVAYGGIIVKQNGV